MSSLKLLPPSEERSRNMRAIKGRDTKPEMRVRRLLHSMGYRYRLHRKDLPGKPDIVFGPRRKVIFVHGCFWHGHSCKAGQRIPKTNTEFWSNKIEANIERDRRQLEALSQAGWTALMLWECELRDADALRDRLTAFLDSIAPAAISCTGSGPA
ncbi:MAG: very short patch repair endonuclease [Rhodobacteraceae bacterium]|nr:very short patch repair endonuclease [Paracoccaceae bacterium]